MAKTQNMPEPPPIGTDSDLPWLAKFYVSSSSLLKRLTALSAVVKPSPTMPVFTGVLLEYYGLEVLHLTACDGQTTLSERLPIEAGTKPWRTVVPLANLLPLLKALPDQPLTCMLTKPEKMPHHYGPGLTRLHVQTINGEFKIACLEAEDWPKLSKEAQEPFALRLHVGELQAALAGTVPVVSGDELRPAMTGVLVDIRPDELRLVATDGHRLNWWRLPAPQDVETTQRYILPSSSAKLLLNLLKASEGELALLLTQGTASVQMVTSPSEGWSWQCRLIDERYPDYENVIPISQPNKLLMSRQELRAAVTRSGIYANNTTHQVRLLLDEQLSGKQLEVSAQNLDFDRECVESLGVHYDGQRLEIGFNARFLLEELALVPGDEVQLEFSTSNRACIISGSGQAPGAPELKALVMPVVLNKYL